MISNQLSIPVDDTHINVSAATGPGVPVVFANGAFSARRAWMGVTDALGPDFRPVLFDMRGRGRSGSSADYSLAAYERDLNAVVDHLSLEAPILVGWSLGAHTVLRWAAAHPGRYRGIVLVDGGYPFAWSGEAEQAKTRQLFRRQAWLLPLLARLGMAGRMTAEQHADVIIELNERAPQLVEAFRAIPAPIDIIAAKGGNTGSAREDSERMRESLDQVLAEHEDVRLFRNVQSNHLQVLRKDAETVVAAIRDVTERG